MRSSAIGLIVVLFACTLRAQHPFPNKSEESVISRAKAMDVASLDRALPKVSLEFFLEYESEGAPIHWWLASNCDRLKKNPLVSHEENSAVCVEADIDLKDNRSASIVVSLGRLAAGSAGVPILVRAMVSDRSGETHAVRRLSDLPMELHRPQPKWPRDLPLPAGVALPLPAV